MRKNKGKLTNARTTPTSQPEEHWAAHEAPLNGNVFSGRFTSISHVSFALSTKAVETENAQRAGTVPSYGSSSSAT